MPKDGILQVRFNIPLCARNNVLFPFLSGLTTGSHRQRNFANFANAGLQIINR
jgi:hypothetical protein